MFLISCSTNVKKYVCGDRACVDKKDFNEYFSKNLTMEILDTKKKKDKTVDLVLLNSNSSILIKEDVKTAKQKKKLRKKEEKEKLKAGKIRVLEERKIRKVEEKNRAKTAKQIAKSSKSGSTEEKIINNKTIVNQTNNNTNKSPVKKNSNKTKSINNQIKLDKAQNENIKSICDEVKDCDINKIAEMLLKKGKNKPFPSISSN